MKRSTSLRGSEKRLDVLRLSPLKVTGPAFARRAKKMPQAVEGCDGSTTQGIHCCVAYWSDATECQSVWWTMNTEKFKLCPYVRTGEPEGLTPWMRGFGE